MFGELDEGEVVAGFGGPEVTVQFLKFGVEGGGLAEKLEAFAGPGFDEGGDHQSVDEFVGALASSDEFVQFGGVGVGVRAGEAAAAAGEDAGDHGEMVDFVAGDGCHSRHPVFGGIGLGPAVEEFEGVGGGFLFEVGVVVEEFEGLAEDGLGPGLGCDVEEGEGDFGHVGSRVGGNDRDRD